MWWTQPQTPLRGLAHAAFQPSHCFQLNQLPCKHMGNRWVFLFSCRSRVLNNIQKDSATYHPTLAKIWSVFFCSPSSQHFSPLRFGKRVWRWKGTDTQCCNLDNVWLAFVKVLEQTKKMVSTEQRQWLPFKRLQMEIFQIQWPEMRHKAEAVMWRMTYADWYVLADLNAVIPASAFWS